MKPPASSKYRAIPREADTQALIKQWLELNGWWVERRNTGAMRGEHSGRSRFVRFSRKGTADLMATKPVVGGVRLIWVECKSATGRQTVEQQLFKVEVESRGHEYILARSLEDVREALHG